VGQVMFHIIYPECRKVSEKQMRTWAEDAIANGEIDGPATLSVQELAEQLQDAGEITLSHKLEHKDIDTLIRVIQQEDSWEEF